MTNSNTSSFGSRFWTKVWQVPCATVAVLPAIIMTGVGVTLLGIGYVLWVPVFLLFKGRALTWREFSQWMDVG